MVIAIAALVVAAAGPAAAAGHYLITSSSQIKAGSIQASDLSKKARTTLKGARGLRGVTGPAGAVGPQGSQGAQGPKGDPGANFTADTTLASGKSESGQFTAWGIGGGYLGSTVNFRIPLGADISAAHTVFVPYTAVSLPTGCTARGQASPGYLCIYEANAGATTFQEVYSVESGSVANGTSGRDGFQMYWTTTGTTGAWSYGQWVVTEP
jgi:hypothetical protein